MRAQVKDSVPVSMAFDDNGQDMSRCIKESLLSGVRTLDNSPLKKEESIQIVKVNVKQGERLGRGLPFIPLPRNIISQTGRTRSP